MRHFSDLIVFTFSCQPIHTCTTVSKKMYLFFTHLQCLHFNVLLKSAFLADGSPPVSLEAPVNVNVYGFIPGPWWVWAPRNHRYSVQWGNPTFQLSVLFWLVCVLLLHVCPRLLMHRFKSRSVFITSKETLIKLRCIYSCLCFNYWPKLVFMVPELQIYF